MVSVVTHIDTPRLRYVLGFLSEYFGVPFRLNESGAPHTLHYSDAAAQPGLLVLRPSGLLSETGIRRFDPVVTQHAAGFPVLFPDNSVLGFDLFSGIFFLLARYEEYAAFVPDSYGRYAHTESIAFRHGFLQRPLVHEWLSFFSEVLFGRPYKPRFKLSLSYDVDMAWSYRHKGLARNAGGLLRALLGRDGSGRERLAVLARLRPDPFDNFAFMNALHEQYGLLPTYFIHAGLTRGRYDKNIPPTHPAMRRLVRRLAAEATVALHPSWKSGDEPTLLAQEKSALEAAAGRPVTASRQHYIRFILPDTYRALIGAGITHDHSMGYATINGFRASVAVPFYWYDLQAESTTTLQLHPFCFMDANARYEQGQDAEQTELELDGYLQVFSKWGGDFGTIWHNTFLGESAGFEGWSVLWRCFLDRVTASRPPNG
ncbi:MAG: hypothetical protein EOO16_02145 [Chitinophagaceae bacterium]|nr:MAG: hypothetical protein EOO16_02145 [Chitinophagaceae bacterium]